MEPKYDLFITRQWQFYNCYCYNLLLKLKYMRPNVTLITLFRIGIINQYVETLFVAIK